LRSRGVTYLDVLAGLGDLGLRRPTTGIGPVDLSPVPLRWSMVMQRSAIKLLISSHCKPLSSKAMVVSVAENARTRFRPARLREASARTADEVSKAG
jgi:hypothetical protein